MLQKATVIKADHLSTVISVMRTSGCDKCTLTESCVLCKKNIQTEAVNNVGAEEGDIVSIESPDQNILLYAAMIFVFPIISAFIGYAVLEKFNIADIYLNFTVVGIFLLFFFVSCYIMNRNAQKNEGVIITEIISASSEIDIDKEEIQNEANN